MAAVSASPVVRIIGFTQDSALGHLLLLYAPLPIQYPLKLAQKLEPDTKENTFAAIQPHTA